MSMAWLLSVAARLAGDGARKIATAGKPCCYGVRGCMWAAALSTTLVGFGAQAHEGHVEPTLAKAAPVQVAPPSSGTHDALTYFTDTPLQDQDGNTVRFYSDELKDKLVLLNVVFTHCDEACPLITRKLKDVRQAMGEPLASKVYFITLTSDPKRDTPEVLKAFAAKQGVDGPNWRFLTGTQEQMDLVLGRLGHIIPSPEQHSTQLIVGDVATKRWAKIRPDAPVDAIAQRLQFLTLPLAGR
jgi:cytochrome oxidase Cu insertion factor (SCO1/SenC/PrrC family)